MAMSYSTHTANLPQGLEPERWMEYSPAMNLTRPVGVILAGALVLASVLCGVPSAAQSPGSAVAQSNDNASITASSFMNDAVNAAAAGEFERAVSLYEQAADSGSTEAMLVLGAMYLEGFGVEANATTGGDWFSRAAELGDPLAQYNLGYLCLMGLGRDQDMQEAFQWFRLAAEQGHADAMHNLALMYEEGLSGPANPALAYFWGLVAEREGASNAEGLAALFERLEAKLSDQERTLARELAGDWRPVQR